LAVEVFERAVAAGAALAGVLALTLRAKNWEETQRPQPA